MQGTVVLPAQHSGEASSVHSGPELRKTASRGFALSARSAPSCTLVVPDFGPTLSGNSDVNRFNSIGPADVICVTGRANVHERYFVGCRSERSTVSLSL